MTGRLSQELLPLNQPRCPFAPDLLAFFAELQADIVNVPTLQPVDPFLDMAGEDLRRRIFLTESETGATLCLRPEFTIPVCLDHIASRAGTPRRYAYLGEVFRQRRDGGNEFVQAGIEDIGETATASADARSIADAYALLSRILPDQALSVVIGDKAIFEAVLAALGLPRVWRMRLARAFGSPALLEAALTDLASPASGNTLPAPIAAIAAEADEDGLSAFVAERMAQTGFSASSGRTPTQIARRIIEKNELRSVRLSVEAFSALRNFLSIRVVFGQAIRTLEEFAATAGLSLGSALDNFAARADAMAGYGLPVDSLTYDAAFGRPLDYYTGLVFEISALNGERILAGGGRYDRLLTLLGAKTPIPGVGFSVWLDRVATLTESRS